jgi:hypothetical protein
MANLRSNPLAFYVFFALFLLVYCWVSNEDYQTAQVVAAGLGG